MNAVQSISQPRSQALRIDEPNLRLVLDGNVIEAQTLFGTIWIREDHLAAALGFSLVTTFTETLCHAGLYKGGRREGTVLTEKGEIDIGLYSLNGALQACLFIQAHRNGDKAQRAIKLMQMLQQLRTPRGKWNEA